MEDDLQIEVRDGRTRGADMVVRGDRPCPGLDERPVRPPDRLEDTIALAVETGRRGCREDGIAFELDQREIRLDTFDDGVQQVAQDRIRGGDAVAEVDPVLHLDACHEAGVPGDVGQEEVSLACGGLRPARIRWECLRHGAMIGVASPGPKGRPAQPAVVAVATGSRITR
jgi:hypothetical protein